MLSMGCMMRTPATALDAQGVPTADLRVMAVPAKADAIAAWQLPPTASWSPYEKLTLLTCLADTPAIANVPDVTQFQVVRHASAAATRLAEAGVPAGTLWVVDSQGAASVVFGATLSQLSTRPIAPVLTFNNWPADKEVVPAEQTLSALLTIQPKPLAEGGEAATPVFLLDAWRLAYRNIEPDPQAMDNRYVLSPSDFPSAEMLQSAGITRVVYVMEDRDDATVEDDFYPVAMAYQGAGIALSLVDFAGLEQIGSKESTDVYLAERSFTVTPRGTTLDDARFYARARGGFGGVRASPVHGRGRGFSGGSPHAMGHGGGHGG
jgi:hypothetical protein